MPESIMKYANIYLSHRLFYVPEHRAVSFEVTQADKIIRASLSPFGNYS